MSFFVNVLFVMVDQVVRRPIFCSALQVNALYKLLKWKIKFLVNISRRKRHWCQMRALSKRPNVWRENKSSSPFEGAWSPPECLECETSRSYICCRLHDPFLLKRTTRYWCASVIGLIATQDVSNGHPGFRNAAKTIFVTRWNCTEKWAFKVSKKPMLCPEQNVQYLDEGFSAKVFDTTTAGSRSSHGRSVPCEGLSNAQEGLWFLSIWKRRQILTEGNSKSRGSV